MKLVCYYQIKLNHLHYQCYYVQKKMLMENIVHLQAKPMKKNYFTL